MMPGKSLTQLHKDYTTDCSGEGKGAVGQRFFSETFYKENFSFFFAQERINAICALVFSREIVPEKAMTFILQKRQQQSRKKIKDKDRADETSYVWTMDVQSVMTCPRTNASALYYRKSWHCTTWPTSTWRQRRPSATCMTKQMAACPARCLGGFNTGTLVSIWQRTYPWKNW